MRHNKSFNHLSRPSDHRRALLKNLSCSLIMSKRLVTTLAKARALRSYVEPLITCSKPSSVDKFSTSFDKKKPNHPYRKAFRYLGNKSAVKELFSQVGPTVGDREGGYTRIIKLSNRLGDGADMCMIELVDYNKIYTPKSDSKDNTAAGTKKLRRSRRRSKGIKKVENS